MSENNGRDDRGRFVEGTAGGPGRPRRAIEREYLQRLSDVVTPEVWAEIVEACVQKAKQGDAGARNWLSRYLLGPEPLTLVELAKREALGIEAVDEVAAAAEEMAKPEGDRAVLAALAGPSVVDRALRLAKKREVAANNK